VDPQSDANFDRLPDSIRHEKPLRYRLADDDTRAMGGVPLKIFNLGIASVWK
jgi:hypothetical protein